MKSKSSSAWSAAKSEEHYGFKRWGSGHISVDDEGFVNIRRSCDGRGIRVLDVVQEALGMGLKAPMVIRFQDLLRYRVIAAQRDVRQGDQGRGLQGRIPRRVSRSR